MDFDMQILVWLLFVAVVAVHAECSDLECLKSIKESLEDPHNVLTPTWSFDNLPEGAICSFYGVTCWKPDEVKVIGLDLSGVGLKGSFPRGLRHCTSLTDLDLSNNQLSGTLPSDISSLIGSVGNLYLSHNNFSGDIPVNLADCPNLIRVNLDSNQLQGGIPAELGCLIRLQVFSVDKNHLSGPVPDFLNGSLVTNRYSNDREVCAGPLASTNDEVDKIKFIGGFVVGWVVSALVTLFLGLFYLPDTCSWCHRRT